LELESFGDQIAAQALLEAIMNGTAVLPDIENTTDISDTICTVTTILNEVPLVPLDENGSDAKGSKPMIIGLTAPIVLLLGIFFSRKHVGMVIHRMCAGTSSSVTDAATLPPGS
jgi:hypothetical protein